MDVGGRPHHWLPTAAQTETDSRLSFRSRLKNFEGVMTPSRFLFNETCEKSEARQVNKSRSSLVSSPRRSSNSAELYGRHR
jgi:hypothetical protein